MSKKRVPKLPWKHRGELRITGWDIPIEYGVDANGDVWKNHAHGGDPCDLVTGEAFILEMQSEGDEIGARKLATWLGLPEPEPEWMRTARAHGWRPPESKA
jgi:hypothetical protein